METVHRLGLHDRQPRNGTQSNRQYRSRPKGSPPRGIRETSRRAKVMPHIPITKLQTLYV